MKTVSKGKNYRNWRMAEPPGGLRSVGNPNTRQQRRARRRESVWFGMSGPNALRDDRGIIPRRVRRSMAKAMAKRKP